MRCLTAGALLALLPALTAPGGGGEAPQDDVVRLESGKEVRGHVVYEDDETVVLRRGTKERSWPRGEVAEVESLARRLARLLERMDGTAPGDPGAWSEHAEWAGANRLPRMAALLWMRVLVLEPADERAHGALEHKRARDGWKWPLGSRSFSLEEVEKRRSRWGRGWELETPHFLVRSNLDLARTVSAALELELLYREVLTGLEGLRMLEPPEPMHAHLYAGAVEFPDYGDGRPAWFDPDAAILHVNFDSTDPWHTLAHEGAHQVLHGTAGDRRRGARNLPAWLSEGLAEYFAAARTGAPGHAAYQLERPARHHFLAHADAEEPLSLSRLCLLGHSDFGSASGRVLPYAQAYTLVDLLLQDPPERRTAFLGYVAGALEGDVREKDLLEALGMEQGELERLWTEHAREVAANLRDH
jgi:hypothetical protein